MATFAEKNSRKSRFVAAGGRGGSREQRETVDGGKQFLKFVLLVRDYSGVQHRAGLGKSFSSRPPAAFKVRYSSLLPREEAVNKPHQRLLKLALLIQFPWTFEKVPLYIFRLKSVYKKVTIQNEILQSSKMK